jgi:hypothetical protein
MNSRSKSISVPDKLRQALVAATTELSERGIARFRRDFPSVPKGWACHHDVFTPLHDRDLRVLVTIEDDVADKDLLDAIPADRMAQLVDVSGNTNKARVLRPPTYHISVSRSARPVSEADVEVVSRTFVPSVASWDNRVASASPSPRDPSKKREFIHLFAAVQPRTDAN